MDQKHYYKAKKRVRKRRDFYSHLAAWISVSAFLLVINMMTSPWYLWCVFPIMGWGIGVVIHGVDALGLGKDWEERAIMEEMNRLEELDEARARLLERRRQQQSTDHSEVPPPYNEEEELELKEFKKLRKEWDDQEFV